MKTAKALPTIFARMLATKFDLLPEEEAWHAIKYDPDFEQPLQKLAMFQQMAISGTFEEALLTYHGQELSQEQLGALQIIFRATKPWLMGHIVGELLSKIESDMQSGKDVTEQAKFIVETFGGSSVPEGTKRQLLVRLAKVDD